MKLKKLSFSIFLLSSFGYIGIHAQDPHIDIIPLGSVVKKLSSNQFIFTEAPVWYGDSVLLFVDDGISSPNVFKYNPIGKQFSIFFDYSVNYNGLACDKDGNLLACESNTKSIVLMNKAGEVIKSLADTFNNKKFNGPNDLIADGKGGVYFTDPVFIGAPNQDKKAVYFIDSTGSVKRVIDDLSAPNGVLLSPDGTMLYVVDTDNKYVYSWNVDSGDTVSGKLNLALLQTFGGISSGADGMAIDIYGNIYVATDKGIQICTAQGTAITTITIPEAPTNCDFGGKDFKTLYITALKNLYSIDLNYPGYVVSKHILPDAIKLTTDNPRIKIYPNPVQNELHLSLSGKTGMLEVFDISGKTVLQKEIRKNNTSIDVSGLHNGIYFIKILSGDQMFTGEFVKN
jgi:gluconolactonase